MKGSDQSCVSYILLSFTTRAKNLVHGIITPLIADHSLIQINLEHSITSKDYQNLRF